jgi:hypothetical protein
MKYEGTLFGFSSSNGSIYNVLMEDKKCYLWKAQVDAEFIGKGMIIKYVWNGDFYDLKIKEVKENYFNGEIFSAGEVWGNVYLWKYQKGEEFLFKGDYIEDGVDSNVFLELRPIK